MVNLKLLKISRYFLKDIDQTITFFEKIIGL